MVESEFSLIDKYFSDRSRQQKNPQTVLGIGDDAAVIQVPQGKQLVVTLDTLVAGRHFPLATQPFDIAYKSLAVNVSDLVAMGASPAFFLLSITLPEADETFISEFSSGLFTAADDFNIALVGGDTCRGPLSVSIQASGLVSPDSFVSRSSANTGDKILVSGELGAAALGLAHLQHKIKLSESDQNACLAALNRPSPRLDLIQLIEDFATAAIDLSDGLLGDLGHILRNSSVGAVIDRKKIPAFKGLFEHDLFEYCLNGGDDYQIVFTVAQKDMDLLNKTVRQQQLDVTVIGEIVEQGFVMEDNGCRTDISSYRGFDHFVC